MSHKLCDVNGCQSKSLYIGWVPVIRTDGTVSGLKRQVKLCTQHARQFWGAAALPDEADEAKIDIRDELLRTALDVLTVCAETEGLRFAFGLMTEDALVELVAEIVKAIVPHVSNLAEAFDAMPDESEAGP